MDFKTALTLALPALAALCAFLWGNKSQARRQLIATVVHDLFQGVHDWDVLEPSAVADRTAALLRQLDEALVANGWRLATAGEKHLVALRVRCLAAIAKSRKPPTPVIPPGSAYASAQAQAQSAYNQAVSRDGGTLKALLVLLAIGLAGWSSPAKASDWTYSLGPTLPFLEYDFGTANPVQVAPGAGVQVSLTNAAFQRPLLGKLYDLLDLDALAFGSLVTANSGQQFGALSVAGAVCTLSSLLCVGVGTHVLSGSQALAPGKPFLLLALSFNVAVAPVAPTSFDKSSWWLPRGNTLYLSGGP